MLALTSTGGLDAYLDYIHSLPFLTKEEDDYHSYKWSEERDEESRNALILSHLRLVWSVVRKYKDLWDTTTDLIQEGNLGLLKAVESFQRSKGRFSAYARLWIKEKVFTFLQSNWSLVAIGKTRASRKIFRELRRTRQELGTNNPLLLSKEMGVPVEDVQAVQALMDKSSLTVDPEVMTYELEQEHDIDVKRLSVHLHEYGESLTGIERTIWNERLVEADPDSLRDVGAKIGLSKQRAHQIQKKVEAGMHVHMAKFI